MGVVQHDFLMDTWVKGVKFTWQQEGQLSCISFSINTWQLRCQIYCEQQVGRVHVGQMTHMQPAFTVMPQELINW